MAVKTVHVSVVTQAAAAGWHAIRLELPAYRDRRTLYSLLLAQLGPHLKHSRKDDGVFTTRQQFTNSKVSLFREEDSLERLFECTMQQAWNKTEAHLLTVRVAECTLEDVD